MVDWSSSLSIQFYRLAVGVILQYCFGCARRRICSIYSPLTDVITLPAVRSGDGLISVDLVVESRDLRVDCGDCLWRSCTRWILIDCASCDSDRLLSAAFFSHAALATVTTPLFDGGKLGVVEAAGGTSVAEWLVWKSSRRRPIAAGEKSALYARPSQSNCSSAAGEHEASPFWRSVNFLVTNLPRLTCCCPPICTHPNTNAITYRHRAFLYRAGACLLPVEHGESTGVLSSKAFDIWRDEPCCLGGRIESTVWTIHS